jgi:hypothetical protein
MMSIKGVTSRGLKNGGTLVQFNPVILTGKFSILFAPDFNPISFKAALQQNSGTGLGRRREEER